MNFGEKIREIRTRQGLSQKDLAKKCLEIDTRVKNGWTQPRIGYYERNERVPDIEDVKVISIALNVDPSKLAFDSNFSIPKFKDTYYYPVLSCVQAGHWTGINLLSSEEGYEMRPSSVKASANSFYLKIEGESMLDRFQPGDEILIDPSLQPLPGDYVVAVNEDGEATFKRYYELGEFDEFGNQHFKLVPLNSVYPTMSTKNFNFKVTGVAIRKIEKLR